MSKGIKHRYPDECHCAPPRFIHRNCGPSRNFASPLKINGPDFLFLASTRFAVRHAEQCLHSAHVAFVKSDAWPSTRLATVEVPAMETGRRTFLKVATLGGAAATVFGFDLKPAYAQLRELKIARATETRSTCPYCAVGCGVIIYTLGDKAHKNVTPSGDPRRRRSRSSHQSRNSVP